jgi:hypothetical protein
VLGRLVCVFRCWQRRHNILTHGLLSNCLESLNSSAPARVCSLPYRSAAASHCVSTARPCFCMLWTMREVISTKTVLACSIRWAKVGQGCPRAVQQSVCEVGQLVTCHEVYRPVTSQMQAFVSGQRYFELINEAGSQTQDHSMGRRPSFENLAR